MVRGITFICVTIYLDVASAFEQETAGITRYQDPELGQFNEICELTLDNRSVEYFHSRLDIAEPNFVYFSIRINGTAPKSTPAAFYPFKWVWTYATSKHVYPYIHWKIDYDIFSFDLLDVKTLKIPYITFYQSESCNLTFGTPETTKLIAASLGRITETIDHSRFSKYQTSYWCFMAEVPGIKQTAQYFLGLYLDYPVIVIKYNCCSTRYSFEVSKSVIVCPDQQIDIWPQCTIYPFIFGIFLFLNSPIILLEILACLSKAETIKTDEICETSETSPLINENRSAARSLPSDTNSVESDWVYLDGTVPVSLTDIFRGLFKDSRLVVYSRIRRFICVLLAPSIIYAKLILYGRIQFKTTNDMMDRGVPLGFLSLIANTRKGRTMSFVPALGGPFTVVLTFYSLSIIFLVLPTSLKKIVQMGLPASQSKYLPLLFSVAQVKQMSQISSKNDPGYNNAANHMRCSFYMLISSLFWKRALGIQRERWNKCRQIQSKFLKFIFTCLLPLYIILCIVEIFIGIIVYSIPFIGFVMIMIRGAIEYVADKMRKGGRVSLILLNSKAFVIISVLILAAIVTFYAYSVCLVYIGSFIFLSEFLVYSYFAVIIYPGISFGYIFFAVIIAYYVFRLIRGFGNRYLDLLNDVVEVSLNIDQQDNHVIHFDGNLIISNVKISNIKSIKINDRVFPVATKMQHSFCTIDDRNKDRVRFRDNAYGIRKDLFKYVISKHLPVHQQVMRVFCHLAYIVLFLLFTISLTNGTFTGPTSQITEVLHVMFIVTVGAVPRVLEVAMADSREHIERDLKVRSLEKTVCQYWREKDAVEML